MIPCQICGENFPTVQKISLDDDIFLCCNDCKVWIDDINTANLIGTNIKSIIDFAIKKKKNDLH